MYNSRLDKIKLSILLKKWRKKIKHWRKQPIPHKMIFRGLNERYTFCQVFVIKITWEIRKISLRLSPCRFKTKSKTSNPTDLLQRWQTYFLKKFRMIPSILSIIANALKRDAAKKMSSLRKVRWAIVFNQKQSQLWVMRKELEGSRESMSVY